MRAKRIKLPAKKITKPAMRPTRKRAPPAAVPSSAAPVSDPEPGPLLKIEEVAAILKVSTRTVRTYAKNGLLRQSKFGGQTVRIHRDSVLKLIA